MPNTRVMLWVALAAILYLNYEAWTHDYREPAQSTAATGAPAASPSATGAPAASNSLANSIPKAGSAPPSAAETAPPPAAAPPAALSAATLQVMTDVLDVTINLKGGEIDRADLSQYPLHKDTPNIPVRLENRDADSLYLLQSGLIGGAGEPAPTHLAMWTAAQTAYVLPAGTSELRVPMTWTDGQGLTVTKTFIFTRGWYAIDLEYEVHNDGTSTRSLASYAQILRRWEHASRSYFDVETYSFKGPDVFDGTKTRDLKVENEADSKFAQSITNGWLASLQHHFVSAIVPPADQPYRYQLQVQDHEYLLSATGPSRQIPPAPAPNFTRSCSSDRNCSRSWRRRDRALSVPPTTACSR